MNIIKGAGIYIFWLLGAACIIGGCYQEYISRQSNDELIDLIADPHQPDRRRLFILDKALTRSLNVAQNVKLGRQLSNMVLSNRHSPLIRKRTLEIIRNRFPEDAAVWLSRSLLVTQEPDIREWIIATLTNLNDTSALPGLIVADNQFRPSSQMKNNSIIAAIKQISADSPENVFTREFIENNDLQTRIAALAGLKRYCGKQRTISILSNLPIDDDLTNLVRFWAVDFRYVPASAPQIYQCESLTHTLTSQQLADLHRIVTRLSERWNYQFEILDSYSLLQTANADLMLSHDELADQITPRLTSLSHKFRQPTYQGARDDYREDLVGRRNLFSYADLLRIKLILDALAHPDTVAQIRQFLQDDLADDITEVAGLCFIDNTQNVVFRSYPPRHRMADNSYFESPLMRQDAAFCLTRWHCHANPRKTGLLAGPGWDDLKFAEYYRTSLVVITYINDKIFNIDYCTNEGEVLDLGNY